MTPPILRIEGLHVGYGRHRLHPVVIDADIEVQPGEVVAIVGESGSGKTTLANAVAGLLPAAGAITSGRITLDGHDLVAASERQWRSIRGRLLGVVPQDPGVSLNPVERVGSQVAEVLQIHGLARGRAARRRAVELLAEAGLTRPEARARQFPHELSGGMRQRVLIAIALAAQPRLLIADEPTSALDVTVQRRVLDHLGDLTREFGTAVLLITHDLAVAADRAARIVVMSQGRIVETGSTDHVLRAPQHPYTRQLISSAPSLTMVRPRRRRTDEASAPRTPVVAAAKLVKAFPAIEEGRRRMTPVVADVTFDISPGETFAIVGESGSGKTTTARMVMGLTRPTGGIVTVNGVEIGELPPKQARAARRGIQMIYQNPYASLDPRFTVSDIIQEPLRAFGIGHRTHRRRRVAELVERVALPAHVLDRRPDQLSGGQRQRVAIARALALDPTIVVCDEPTSALDVTVQAQILELLLDLQRDLGTAYLFISHDLAVVRQVADRVAVMHNGRIVDQGATATVFDNPTSMYTRELLDAIPGKAHR
ncbi:ABC transporter ATP-binding protein [Acrocarpospora macrocephala]|uniref:Peptide ABC transporter ATP-binding protein n=1 Tax=Acrocarpospora macrocephala TaxID=150177 RepID=A0A5M3WLH2_9ACTN|nr:ABC transporter ATP-binding protein [Acrocarpospora macrocephala]GES07138.1 peptide ABC transporter ATP-binding protein [Acrocarpospora macrocephala]